MQVVYQQVIFTWLVCYSLEVHHVNTNPSMWCMLLLQPRQQSSWGQHGAHLGPVGPRWAPCWPHEPCYLGSCDTCWLYPHLLGLLCCHCDNHTIVSNHFSNPEWYGQIDHMNLTRTDYIDGLVQERCNSSALAMELCLSCTNPLI